MLSCGFFHGLVRPILSGSGSTFSLCVSMVCLAAIHGSSAALVCCGQHMSSQLSFTNVLCEMAGWRGSPMSGRNMISMCDWCV